MLPSVTDSPWPSPGQRVVVVGNCGTGKTYVARRLADLLAVPYVCNDAVIWGPNWTPTPRPLRLERFEALTRGPGWTYDGNVGSLTDPEDLLILRRADTLVWLDLPRWAGGWQLLRRSVRRVWTREELWHGNRETFRGMFLSRDSILWWAWRLYGLRRRQYSAIAADPAWSHLICIRLGSRRQVDRWLAAVQAGTTVPGDGRDDSGDGAKP